MDNIKPCPFCGMCGFVEEVKTVGWRGGKARTLVRYRVQCDNATCLGHHGRLYTNRDVAIKKWNTRAKTPTKTMKRIDIYV